MKAPSVRLLITGGAGFIGSHFVKHMVTSYPQYHIVNLDALTYAGNLKNLELVEGAENYTFVQGDIRDKEFLQQLFEKYKFDRVVHLAAESHVDRSILDPDIFIETNVQGTLNLLNIVREHWELSRGNNLFYHISTDEVYGSLGPKGFFTETTPYAPNSPYAASKAAADHLVRAHGNTYGTPFIISNCSNNYGPNQFPEKLIPLVLHRILESKDIPVYGDGKQVRDWLYVADHVHAMDLIFHEGEAGETYIIGGRNERTNIDVVRTLCKLVDQRLGRDQGTSEKLIRHVADRPGHDIRYAIDPSKIEQELGWKPYCDFEKGLSQTITWYMENPDWVQGIVSGDYKEYYQRQYGSDKNARI